MGGSLIGIRSLFRKTPSVRDRDLLDQSTLRQRVVAGIMALSQRWRRGADALPLAVAVTIQVGDDASLSVVERFIDDPAFDTDVGADLSNRLVGSRVDAMPVRLYRVEPGPHNDLKVTEALSGTLAWLTVEGGDCHGTTLEIEVTRAEYRLGRGDWHGDDTVANDLVVSHGDRFVSRRAAVLRRAGARLEVASRGQGDNLLVIHADGKTVRPSHTRRGRLRIQPGDSIALTDGGARQVTLRLHEQPPSDPTATTA